MRIFFLAVIVVFCALPTAAGAEPAPQNFAQGFEITVPEDGLLYRFAVPDACLSLSTDPGQQDLAVFNAEDMLLPTAPYYPATTLKYERIPAEKITALQKMDQPQNPDSGPSTVIIVDGQADTAATRLEPEKPSPIVTAYLAGLPESGLQATGVIVRWQADELTQIVRVRVEQADSLNAADWQVIADGPLAQVQGGAGDPGLASTRFSLSGQRIGRYLKISFPELNAAPELLDIAVDVQRSELPEYQLLEEELQALPEAVLRRDTHPAAVFELDLGGRKWVNSLEISPASPVIWRHASLFGKQHQDDDWQHLNNLDLFSIARSAGQRPVTNEALLIQAELPRYLRVEVPEGARGKADISVKMLYLQPGMIFQAQAPGPYILACGSGTVRISADIDPALLGLSEVRVVAVDDSPQTLGGDAALVAPTSEEPVDKVRIVLWIALGLGVLALGGMIFALYRNMKKG